MKKTSLLFLILVFLLSACSMPAAGFPASGVQAWIDQPASGFTMPIGAIPVKAHARHVDGSGISRIEFFANGVPIGSVDTDPAAPIVYGEVNWNPGTPGLYTLFARAFAGNGSADSSTVLVCVSLDAKEPLPSQGTQCAPGQEPDSVPQDGPTAELPPDKLTEIALVTASSIPYTFTPIPALTITPIPPTSTSVPPTFAPPPTLTSVPPTFAPPPATLTSAPVDNAGPKLKNLFHTPNPSFYGGCGGLFTIQAAATDSSGISYVVFGYHYEGAVTGGDVTVNGAPIGNSTYEVTIDHNDASQAYKTLVGASGYIRWYVQAVDVFGNSSIITDQVAEVQYCPG